MNQKITPLLGIIGGSGPLACLDIEKKIFQATQLQMGAKKDSDYPSLLIYQFNQFSEHDEDLLTKEYEFCAKTLNNAGCELILIACHSAHAYIRSIQSKLGVEFISLVDTVVEHINHKLSHISQIGILSTEATLKMNLYQDKLSSISVTLHTPSKKFMKNVLEGIYQVKSGKLDLAAIFYKPIHDLKNKGCNNIILACTEIPILLSEFNKMCPEINFIDPNRIVAESIVKKITKIR